MKIGSARDAWDWLKHKGFTTMLAALFYGYMGFILHQAYFADKLRKQAEDDHQDSLASIEKNVSKSVEKSLKPIRADLQGDLKNAMVMCREASFRSIRAADKVEKASDTASSVFDAQKEALRKELDK